MNATEQAFASLQCWNTTIAQRWLCEAAQNPQAFMTFFVALLFWLPVLWSNATREPNTDRSASELANEVAKNLLACNENNNNRVEFSIEGEEDQCAVIAYMRQFGIPISLPECLSVTRFTQADLLQIGDDADGLQTTILVALDEDDQQPWRPMHVQVKQSDDAARSNALLVSLSLPQQCCPQSRNSYDDYFTQCLMVENFMQAVCDHRDH